MRSLGLALVLAALGCTSSTPSECSGVVTTENPIVTVTDGGEFESDAGPGSDCYAACGIYVAACSDAGPCSWRARTTCVHCMYNSTCE